MLGNEKRKTAKKFLSNYLAFPYHKQFCKLKMKQYRFHYFILYYVFTCRYHTFTSFKFFVVPNSNKHSSNPTWQKPTYCLEVKGKKIINQSLRDFRYYWRLWFVVICKNQSPITNVKISETSEANYYTAFPFIERFLKP